MYWSAQTQFFRFYSPESPYDTQVHWFPTFFMHFDGVNEESSIKYIINEQSQNQRESVQNQQEIRQNNSHPSWLDLHKTIPNKQKLFGLFVTPGITPKQVRKRINQMCCQRNRALNGYYRSVGEKIFKFKKTKQEITKFLVRKVWRKQKDTAFSSRTKLSSQFKSMNRIFLRTVFQEREFARCYKEMLQNLKSDLEELNMERFNKFYCYLMNCTIKGRLAEFKNSSQIHNKLPYPYWWKQQIIKTAYQLYAKFLHDKPNTNQPICGEQDFELILNRE